MKNNDFDSISKLAYDAMRVRSLSVAELVDQTGIDPDYARVLIGRWLRADVLRRGAIRDGRTTYTARGAANLPRFVRGRGKVPEMIMQHCQKRWQTAKQLIAATGISGSSIRKHLGLMVTKRKLVLEVRENGLYHYRAK